RRKNSTEKTHRILSRQNSRSPLAMENFGICSESTDKPCDANGKSIKSIQDDEKVVFENPLYEEFKTSQM
ncbi:Hypothetical predicted protein, partial [Paramuricea clavata]